MTKIAFVGAGSLEFTRGLVRDVLTFPLLQDAKLSLMDIDPKRLDFAHRSVSKIVNMGKYAARVVPPCGTRMRRPRRTLAVTESRGQPT